MTEVGATRLKVDFVVVVLAGVADFFRARRRMLATRRCVFSPHPASADRRLQRPAGVVDLGDDVAHVAVGTAAARRRDGR